MITDFRINAKGELEGKVVPPTKWEEMYTKDDIVTMLTELKTEIEEIEMGNNVPFGFEPVNKFYEGISASSRVIQQKIDKLKGEEDGNK